MRNKLVLTFIAAAILLYGFISFAGETPNDIFEAKIKKLNESVTTISPGELMSWVKSKKKFALIDVRESTEVEAGKIETPETKYIPLGMLDVIAAKGAIKTDQTIVVYCKKGSRGLLAAAMLMELGFKDVYNLEGGIHGWMEAGFPITNSLGTFKAVPYELTNCGEE